MRRALRVVALSSFDVWPAVDGGQTRIAELYSRFSADVDATVICYDVRARAERRYRLAPNLQVVVLPASPADKARFEALGASSGLWLHDALCLYAHELSDPLLRELDGVLARADAVVASHPWLAPTAFAMARADALRVYEAHNVEADLKAEYFAGARSPAALSRLLDDVRAGERRAVRGADVVTAVSRADGDRLGQLYEVVREGVSVLPNGCRAAGRPLRAGAPPSAGRPLRGVYVGSSNQGNVRDYRKARALLAAAGFAGSMTMVGSLADADRSAWPSVAFRETWLGFQPDEVKEEALASADFALHLAFGGGGTSLKLLDYMASGTPVITNAQGARGLEADGSLLMADTPAELHRALHALTHEPEAVARRAARARELVERDHDWTVLAARFEGLLRGETASFLGMDTRRP